jgi:hypothetical protein
MHLFLHYLDNIRGAFYSSNIGNGPEAITEIVVGVVVWNKWLGPRYKKWHAAELAKHHKALHDMIREGDGCH